MAAEFLIRLRTRPAVHRDAVNHAGRQYKNNHVRHANPVIQLVQVILSPQKMNAMHSSRIPWINTL
jgi:hypothetical protein